MFFTDIVQWLLLFGSCEPPGLCPHVCPRQKLPSFLRGQYKQMKWRRWTRNFLQPPLLSSRGAQLGFHQRNCGKASIRCENKTDPTTASNVVIFMIIVQIKFDNLLEVQTLQGSLYLQGCEVICLNPGNVSWFALQAHTIKCHLRFSKRQFYFLS